MYGQKIRSVLSPSEQKFFDRLKTPQKIQDYLDTLPINFETKGETYMSPRRTIEAQTAHCFEGALLAAAALAYHGQKPLILDIQTASPDEDHVVALFKQHGRWGALSKTNHAILRYRDPVYMNVRELALSFFNEYFLETGRKTMRTYSVPFDLSGFAPEAWVTADIELQWLVDEIDDSRHFPIAPEKNLGVLRRVSNIERKAVQLTEWSVSSAMRTQRLRKKR